MQSENLTSRSLLIGVLCGTAASFGWAAGFVAAKHGVAAGFTPADLALHRFVWLGLAILPVVLTRDFPTLGGIGWGRGFALWFLSGPVQAWMSYTGWLSVPLGHGTVIQPACATLFGLMLAAFFVGETLSARRLLGGAIIVCGLLVFGIESVVSIGSHGVAGDLFFAGAGISWAIFGTLLRQWQISGTRAALAVGALSIILFVPFHGIVFGYETMLRMGLMENLLQAVMQGLFAGVVPILLFGIAVTHLGAGRAATFTSLVPCFSLVLGYTFLGAVPSWPQVIGLVVVVTGFQFTVRR